jgi:hypothetical protein
MLILQNIRHSPRHCPFKSEIWIVVKRRGSQPGHFPRV